MFPWAWEQSLPSARDSVQHQELTSTPSVDQGTVPPPGLPRPLRPLPQCTGTGDPQGASVSKLGITCTWIRGGESLALLKSLEEQIMARACLGQGQPRLGPALKQHTMCMPNLNTPCAHTWAPTRPTEGDGRIQASSSQMPPDGRAPVIAGWGGEEPGHNPGHHGGRERAGKNPS